MNTFKMSRSSRTFRALMAMDIRKSYNEPWSVCDIGRGILKFAFQKLLLVVLGVVVFYPITDTITCALASLSVGYWAGLDDLAKIGLVVWFVCACWAALIFAGIGLTLLWNARSGPLFNPRSLPVELYRSFKDKTCVQVELTE